VNTERRRETLALTLEALAAQTRNANNAAAFEAVLNEIESLTRNGYHARTVDYMREADYFECDYCGSDWHTEAERGGLDCRAARIENEGR
jgi:hypothetical protein